MERQNEWKSFLKTPFKNCRYIYPILYDLWTNYTVDENMKKEIFKKGVVVYERE